MADRSRGLLRKVNCRSGTPYACSGPKARRMVMADGIGRQVTRPPPQSELQKQNTLCVLITELQVNGNSPQLMRPPPQSELQNQNELQANGNGRQVMRPPPQGELWKRNTLCVNCRRMAMADRSRGLLLIAEVERLMCVQDGSAGEWKWQKGRAASSAE